MTIKEAKFVIKYKAMVCKELIQKAQQRIDKTEEDERK